MIKPENDLPTQTGVGSSDLVLLRCPECKRSRRVYKRQSDPPATVEIEMPCPECWKDGTFEEPFYFDKNHKQILAQ